MGVPRVGPGPCVGRATMSFRTQQVASTLKRAITKVMARQLADPRIEGLVSITNVEVSPDLKQAFVSVSVLPEKHQKTTLAGLNHATRHIHSLVKKELALKTVPHLEFRLDRGIKKEAAVMDAIRRGMSREQRSDAEGGAVGSSEGGGGGEGAKDTTTPDAQGPAPPGSSDEGSQDRPGPAQKGPQL